MSKRIEIADLPADALNVFQGQRARILQVLNSVRDDDVKRKHALETLVTLCDRLKEIEDAKRAEESDGKLDTESEEGDVDPLDIFDV